MPLENLIARMEQRDTPDTPCNPGGVSREPACSKACTPATSDTPATDENEAMQLARRAIAQAALTDKQKAARLADLRRDPAIARFWALAWPEALNSSSKASQ